MNENKFSITKKCGFLGICANIFLMIIKAIVGFTFKSQSMMKIIILDMVKQNTFSHYLLVFQ